jgi:DNA primase
VACIPGGAPDDHPAFLYLQGRGISPTRAKAGEIGFIADYQAIQRRLVGQFPLPDLQSAGLFNANGNLRLYRHQLILPFVLDRRVYGLQARNIRWRDQDEDGPKELLVGSPSIPFNTDILTEAIEQVFLSEGVIDCLSFTELGLPAVGIPGANGFKAQWVPLFHEVPEVIVAFDNDDAGRRGTERIVGMFEAAGRAGLKTIRWPNGIKDANEFLTKRDVSM